MATDVRTGLSKEFTTLRNFGLQMAGFILVLFVALLPWLLDRPLPWWPWPLALVMTIVALLRPTMLKPVHSGVHRLARGMQFINTRILLTLVWCLMIVPTGLLMRLCKRSRLRQFDHRSTGSNRQPRPEKIKPEAMDRPF